MVELGVYRHYKGGLYLVIAVGEDKDSRTHRMVVIYRTLDDLNPKYYTRTLASFTRSARNGGKLVPRYKRVGD